MASSLGGYLRLLRLFNSGLSDRVDAVLRLGAMDHGCAPSLSQQSASFFGVPSWCGSRLCGLLKLLEPNRQPVAVRPILDPVRPIDQRSGDSLQRAIMNFEQPIGDVNSVQVSRGGFWSAAGHEITGCSRRSSASIKMRATSTSRGSDEWEVAHRPR